ncbi:pentatricopeptide repeat-containing protein At1g09220, mitochondrial-like [Miscanthus floridulus]|uniref:pentatricopeptide repeat-containing protein At1g09220, mitochondrial-like n=1 Tax=Miscanthus floridulus TaxID=154761 RepID=UPI00345A7604
MMAEGISPSEITVLAVVPAISNLGGILMGEMLHGYCEKKGIVSDAWVGNSLIDLYAKIGSVQNSLKLFDEMLDRRNLVSWTSIISGFAMHGLSVEALELFAEMRRAGIRPNRITFLSVINACSHGGLVEQGLAFFKSMVYEYNIDPEIKNFGCIIDMLVWRVEMGKRAIKMISDLERESGGDFAVLSSVLNELGRFSDAEQARKLLDERKIVKVPGLALVGEIQ